MTNERQTGRSAPALFLDVAADDRRIERQAATTCTSRFVAWCYGVPSRTAALPTLYGSHAEFWRVFAVLPRGRRLPMVFVGYSKGEFLL